jgi:hypothetical protein
MTELLQWYYALKLFIKCYKTAMNNDCCTYGAYETHGVVQFAVFVGVGRNAWRISQRAIEEFEPVESK